MKRLLATMALLVALIPSATLAASPSPGPQLSTYEQKVTDITAKMVEEVQRVAAETTQSPIGVWDATSATLDPLNATVNEFDTLVNSLEVPPCEQLWLDTLKLGLKLLKMGLERVNEVGGAPSVDDRQYFGATTPPGYALLVQSAPELLLVSGCQPAGDDAA